MLKAIALVALSLALEGAFILHAVVAAPPARPAAVEMARGRSPGGPAVEAGSAPAQAVARLYGGERSRAR
jgi:hypothetical protein